MKIDIKDVVLLEFERQLDLVSLLDQKSFFLFGPRGVGKSWLIRQQLASRALVINLLDSQLFYRLSAKPWLFIEMLDSHPDAKVVVVDEIQRVPELLNEVHRMIEERGIRFLLTASSARKLKQQHTHLLAGRAWEARLFPWVSHEIPNFQWRRVLTFVGLPAVYNSSSPQEDLHAYVHTYLKEEIQIEARIRNLPSFMRFLNAAALTSGQIINFTRVASDVELPVSTVRAYYQLLEDTFVGFMLPVYGSGHVRKAIATAKFYLFDVGVRNALCQAWPEPNTQDFGVAMEHWLVHEIRAYLAYRRRRDALMYWRTQNGFEVDVVVGDVLAVEIKASDKVSNRDLKGLRALRDEGRHQHYVLVSQDPLARMEDGVLMLPVDQFLEKLWSDHWLA